MSQKRTDPPVATRSQRQARKRRAPLALALVPVALIAVGVVLILTLGGGEGGIIDDIIPGGDDGPSDEVPAFDFKLSKVDIVATDEDAEIEALRPTAEAAAEEVAPVLDDLYTNGFLDPTNWRDGDYAEILTLFTADAATSAQGSLETLTLGATAGDVYETVTPRKGSLRFTVLFDQDGAVDTIVVRVRFYALGARTDGTFISIVSAGQVFLRDVEGWKITAFDMRRNDQETEAPTPSPSASTSAATGGTATA